MSAPSAELGPNAYDALFELDEVFEEEGVDYRFLGGMAATLVSNLDGVHPDSHALQAPGTLHKPTVRERGTVRDVDTLLLTTDKEEAIRATEIANEVLEGRLVFRAFRFKDHDAHLSGFNAFRRRIGDYTSERTMDEEGNTYYVAHPIVTPVARETYEPWTAFVGERGSFKTANPAVSIASYEVRSLGGTRPRNQGDVDAMRGRLREVMPDYDDFEAETAADIQKFRAAMQAVGVGSVLHEMRQGNLGQAGDLALFMARSRWIGFLDAQQWAVDLAQGRGPVGERLMPILDRIAGSDKETV